MRPDWWVWFAQNRDWFELGWDVLKAGGVITLLAYLGHPRLRAEGLLTVGRQGDGG